MSKLKDKVKNIINNILISDTLVYRLCKWVVASSIGLIAIPIACLAIIVTLYTGLFKGDIKKDKESLFRIETYYNSFHYQKQIKEDSLAISNLDIETNKRFSSIEITENKTQYTHILVIDRTGSTENEPLNDKLTNFYGHVKNCLLPNIEVDKIEKKFGNKKLSIKHLLSLRYYRELRNKVWDESNYNNTKKIIPVYFDGEEFTYPLNKRYEITNEFNPEYYSTTNKDSVRDFIESRTLDDVIISTRNHESDFSLLLKEIQQICSKFREDTIILTVISDFLHDKKGVNIEESSIENFKKETGNIFQYNLIYCPPTNLSKREKSKSLINLLEKHIKGFDNIVTIDLMDYNNQSLENDLINVFDKKISDCLSPMQINDKDIHFYYPRYNIQGLDMAKAEIRIKNNGKNFSWRIASPIDEDKEYLCSYSVNENKINKKTFALNKHRDNLNAKDSILFIEMRYNPKIESNKYRLEIYQDGGNSVAYPIKLLEYMSSDVVIKLGMNLLNILCFFIIIIVLSGSFLLSRFIYIKRDNIKIPFTFWCIIVELLIIVGLLGWLIGVVLWGWERYVWLIITNIVTILCGLWLLFVRGYVIHVYRKSKRTTNRGGNIIEQSK